MNLFEIAIINSCFIFGINELFYSGMILGKIGDRIRKLSKKHTSSDYFKNGWLSKPLIDCPPCMASLYGAIGFLFTGLPLVSLPLYIVCLAGLNGVINDLRHG